jgi:hypothetical protein
MMEEPNLLDDHFDFNNDPFNDHSPNLDAEKQR